MSESDLLSFGAAMLAALAVGALAYAFLHPYFSGEREKDSRLKGVLEPKGRDSLSVLEQTVRMACLSPTYAEMLEKHRQEALKRQFPGMPGFVYRGKIYFGALSKEAWEKILTNTQKEMSCTTR